MASLKTVVALSLATIHNRQGYVSPARSSTKNTALLVKQELEAAKTTTLDFAYMQLAEEVIEFFKNLHEHPDYKAISEKLEGPEYEACQQAAQQDEVTSITFPYVVLMPFLYGNLKPRRPIVNPDELDVKLLEPGHFMGTIGKLEKFFVKLVYVGRADVSKGTTFKVVDRNDNVGFFQDRADKYEGKLFLNDCFYMIAQPTRHTVASNGEKHTTFRTPEVLADDITQGRGTVDPKFDESVGRKFSRGPI